VHPAKSLEFHKSRILAVVEMALGGKKAKNTG
jgi:hypothetical protein